MTATRTSSLLTKRVGFAAAAVVLVLVVVFDTKYLTAREVAKLNPPAFNAQTYGRQMFPKIAAKVKAEATDVTELAPAIDRDLAAAGKRYGHDLGSGNFSFAMKATGTATQVDDAFVLLKVGGVPAGTEVRIPLGTALNGTPVRDCTGTISYGDFADQTDYQSAANQFKLRMQQDVLAKLDKKGLKGKKVTVEGGWNTGGPPRSYIIQPTSIAVGS
jgi:predicted lipoprotein